MTLTSVFLALGNGNLPNNETVTLQPNNATTFLQTYLCILSIDTELLMHIVNAYCPPKTSQKQCHWMQEIVELP